MLFSYAGCGIALLPVIMLGILGTIVVALVTTMVEAAIVIFGLVLGAWVGWKLVTRRRSSKLD